MKKDENGFPRRSRIDLLSPVELAIYEASAGVESLGADIRLTNAGLKLQEARNLVADWIEDQSE